MDCAEARHNKFHPDTKRVMITFRGSQPEELELLAEAHAEAKRDGTTFADVVRAALRAYVSRRRRS